MSKHKQKRKKTAKLKTGTVFFTLLSLCLIVVITYIFSIHFLEIYEIYQEKKDLTEKITKLNDDNEKLSDEVQKLKDPEYIARYAREKFLYSKDGEFIIKMP